jgi:hypothetical protein
MVLYTVDSHPPRNHRKFIHEAVFEAALVELHQPQIQMVPRLGPQLHHGGVFLFLNNIFNYPIAHLKIHAQFE